MEILKTQLINFFKIGIILFTFLLNLYPFSEVLALNSIDGHNFVSDAVRNVGPAVVRIDTERLVETTV